MNVKEKKQIVDDLREKLSRSKVVIITDYKGLDVQTINDLRRKLREDDIEYRVVKNTLLERASEGTDASLIRDSFKGPNAIVLSYEDPVAPAKLLTQFAKDHKHLEIKVGVMGDRVLDVASIKALAVLPSREQLLATVLAGMVAVPTSLVSALSNIPRGFINVLNAIKEQKEAA